MVAELEEVGHLGVARHNHPVAFGLDSRALFIVIGHVPAGEAGLALAIL